MAAIESDIKQVLSGQSITKSRKGNDPQDTELVQSLGSVRIQDTQDKERILVPRPSSDPNDPLNW